MRSSEEEAKAVGESKTLLRKRLTEARSMLADKYRKRFTKKAKFDFDNKRLISDDGNIALEWRVRELPDLPISCYNQQTSTGVVIAIVID